MLIKKRRKSVQKTIATPSDTRKALREPLLARTLGKDINLNQELGKLFKTWLSQARNEADNVDEKSEGGNEYIFRIESKAITTFYNELEHYKQYISKNYGNRLWNKGKWYPRQWMLDDDKIFNLLKRYKITDVLNALEKDLFSSENLQYATKTGEGKKALYPYACFVTNTEFYEKIIRELELKRITIQKYLTALHNVGAFKKLPKTGQYEQRNETLYALGYFTDYGLKRFLTKERKSQLRGFKI